MQRSNYSKWTLLGQATTATAASVTGEVDMNGYEGCEFIGVAGSTATVAHTLTVKVGASTTDTFVAISGATKATTGGNDFAVVDVYRPVERWLQAVWSTTANTEKLLLARQYGPRVIPVSSTYDTQVIGSAT